MSASTLPVSVPLGRWGWLLGLTSTTNASYVLRTLLAIFIALWLAFWLHLPSPGSAAVTVMIVANPSRGAIISKGVWRILGTSAGATAGVVIVTFFQQSTLLFLATLAFWLGFCTFLSSMFRYSRSYGAVLSGYTAALVVFSTLNDPPAILTTALDRLAVVTLGVVVSAAVTMALQPAVSHATLRHRLLQAIARIASFVIDETDFATLRQARERLMAEAQQLDEALEYAGVETPDTRRHANSLRGALVAIGVAPFALLHVNETVQQLAVNPQALPPGLGATVAQMRSLLIELTSVPQADAPTLCRLSTRIVQLLDAIRKQVAGIVDVVLLEQLARLVGFLSRLEEIVGPVAAWDSGRPPYRSQLNLSLFRDYRSAVRNAVRTASAVMLGGLFWYITAWPAGPQMLAILGPICALMSTTPSAAAASVDFLKGVLLSTLAAFICLFFFLPPLSGFPALALAMLPFLLLGISYSTVPGGAISALGFVVLFITQLGLANTMHFDGAAFLNSVMVYIAGAGGSVLVFRILLPPNPAADAGNLARLIRRAFERIDGWQWLEWQSLQNQRMHRLLARLQAFPAQRSKTVEAAASINIVGQEIFRLHQMLGDAKLPAEAAPAMRRALACLGRLKTGSTPATDACAAADRLERAYHDSPLPNPILLQAAAAFRVIASVLPEAELVFGLKANDLQAG